MATDTATLKDEALQLFASRTVANANRLENSLATVISYVRFFDSNGDYIELPVARNTSMPPAGGAPRDLIFDETGGTEADPEYTSWTQDYRDLNLLVFVPRSTKTYDISGYSWGYSTDPFTVTDYKLYNEGGIIIAEAADTTIGFSIVQGTRYLLRFIIRLFNDVVEQDYGENTRCIVVQEGLSTVARRLLHEGSLQDYSRPPMFMGVGGKGAYYIANGSDGRWTYNSGTSTYTNIGTVLFPSSTAEGDAMAFCREGSPPDWIEGIYFNIATAGTLDDDVQLLWEYFDVNDAWVALKGVVDGTSNFSTDGSVRWAIPTDIQTDAEEKAGTVGSYYRVRLVGGGWASDPERPTVAAATNVQPLVLQTASTETDLQVPFTRKSADLIVTPFTGTAAKVSASFGLGGIPEEYDSDGYMIANGFEPVREIALFTTPGVEQEEMLTLGSHTGAVAGEVATIPDTNPFPLKIITVRNTTTGEIYPVNERVVYDIVEETGGNYLTPMPGVPAVTVEVTYIGYAITPTITPQNILSVSGNTQTLFGPVEVVRYSSHLFPGDSDAGGDTMLTPRYVRNHGVTVDAGGSDAFDPNLAENVSAAGRTANPENFATVGEFKGHHKRDGYWIGKYMSKVLGGNEHAPNADQYWTAGWPLMMTTFDMSDYKDMENTMLHISAMGTSGDQVSIGVFVWAAGDPTSNNVRARVTGWKLLTQSRNVSNNLDLQSLITATLDFRWAEQGDGTRVSPIIDERNRMYFLLAPMKKTLKDGKKRVRMPAYAAWGSADDSGMLLNPYQKRETRKVLMEELGIITLNYIGLTGSPVNKTNETYKFRRGIDWRYVLGDTEGYWVQTTNNPENHTRKLRDGSEYVPNTPTHKVVEEDEIYYFGTHPDGADWPTDAGKTGDLYVRSKPVGASGVFVWEKGGEKIVNTVSGTEGSAVAGITVNKVSWDTDAIWNDRDQDYEWDHKQSGSGGDGAGLINVTFKAIDWSNTKAREVGVRYLAQEDPELTVTYLRESPVMFARAHLSPYSFASVVRPDYGDKLRVFFEIQFGHKRSA